MSIFSTLFTEIIYRPLLNGLVFIYSVLPYSDIGLAIVVLTVVVRVLLHPTLIQTIRSQRALARLQPKLRDLQKKLKDDKEEQAKQTMALYKEHGVHPLSGCVPLLIQLPVLIGLYQVFWHGIASFNQSLIYAFIPAVHAFNPVAFGVLDLTHRHNYILAATAGISQFLQAKFLPQPNASAGGTGADFTKALQWQTMYGLPVIIAVIAWSLPAAVPFYWTVLNLLAIVQQLWIQKRLAADGK